MKFIKSALEEWDFAHVKNIPRKIDALKSRLAVYDEKGEEDGLSVEEIEEMRGITHDIHSLSRVNTSITWHKSRLLWLKDGDANSKYFHSVISSRRRRNSIVSLLVNGTLVEGVQPIRNAVYSHFKDHFAAPCISRLGVENLHFQNLSYVKGNGLIKSFSAGEVKATVWDCDSFKSPGPYGVNFSFIKAFWDELKDDIMRFMSDFHRNGKLTRGINTTFIALIPKVDSPQRLNDFGKIFLFGCLYKILSKVLANHLFTVMGVVISQIQTAFVKDRQILDGILIANEAVDEARKSKKELMLFKVGFEKAYYSVDWGYLDAVMQKMAFLVLWRKWIKQCVTITTASIIVNGIPTDEFPLKRGLHQGAPLSFPFLISI